MKVYAIVVLYNGKKWVDRCFGSLRLSELPLNVIVIDNASTDGSQDIVRSKYPEVDFIPAEKNLGFGAANNIGIRKAYDEGADYVFLLNQDAWIEPDTVKKLVEVSNKNDEYGVISPMHLTGNGNRLEYGFSMYLRPDHCANFLSDLYVTDLKDALYPIKFVNAAAWLLRRDCIEKVGGFSPVFYHYGEDDNYIHRVHYHGMKVGIYPYAKIYHDIEQRATPESMLGKNLQEQMLLIQYSNPFNNNLLDKDLKIYFRRVLKSLMSLSIRNSILLYKKYKKYSGLRRHILSNLETSKKTGLSFLHHKTAYYLNSESVVSESKEKQDKYQ